MRLNLRESVGQDQQQQQRWQQCILLFLRLSLISVRQQQHGNNKFDDRFGHARWQRWQGNNVEIYELLDCKTKTQTTQHQVNNINIYICICAYIHDNWHRVQEQERGRERETTKTPANNTAASAAATATASALLGSLPFNCYCTALSAFALPVALSLSLFQCFYAAVLFLVAVIFMLPCALSFLGVAAARVRCSLCMLLVCVCSYVCMYVYACVHVCVFRKL